MIGKLGGTLSKLEEADFVVVHLLSIATKDIFKNKNIVNCKFITDSLLNLKIPNDNLSCYKVFA